MVQLGRSAKRKGRQLKLISGHLHFCVLSKGAAQVSASQICARKRGGKETGETKDYRGNTRQSTNWHILLLLCYDNLIAANFHIVQYCISWSIMSQDYPSYIALLCCISSIKENWGWKEGDVFLRNCGDNYIRLKSRNMIYVVSQTNFRSWSIHQTIKGKTVETVNHNLQFIISCRRPPTFILYITMTYSALIICTDFFCFPSCLNVEFCYSFFPSFFMPLAFDEQSSSGVKKITHTGCNKLYSQDELWTVATCKH